MHPILLIISFTGATVTSFLLLKKSFLKSIKWLLPFMLVAAILNPLLIHEGETAILYINEQPITVEAIVYGFAASVMLIAIIFWFSAFNAVMTSDKFLYLFAKVSPAVALLISLTMRLVPYSVIKLRRLCMRNVRLAWTLVQVRFGIVLKLELVFYPSLSLGL